MEQKDINLDIELITPENTLTKTFTKVLRYSEVDKPDEFELECTSEDGTTLKLKFNLVKK